VAEAPADLSVTPDPAEVSALRWISLRDLLEEVGDAPERFTPWLRIYLQDHRDRIFGRHAGSN
jgi:isopentenyl-diphosphate delta-isomerase